MTSSVGNKQQAVKAVESGTGTANCKPSAASNGGSGVCNGGFVADDAVGVGNGKPPAEAADGEHPASATASATAAPRGRYLDGLRALGRRETLWPLMLVVSFFVIHHWTGLSGLRPFMVPVFRQFGLPVDAHWLTVGAS